MVCSLRNAIAREEKRSTGKATPLYYEMANKINLERQMSRNAKRERQREDQYKEVEVSNAKRQLATAQREEAEARRKVISEASLAAKAKKEQDLAAAAARRHLVWLQTQFASQHAGKMLAQKKSWAARLSATSMRESQTWRVENTLPSTGSPSLIHGRSQT